MMKLLFIADNFPPVVDGVGDYTYHLGRQLARNGHRVYVICSRKAEIVQFAGTQTGLHVHPVIEAWNGQAAGTITGLVDEIKPDWIIPQYVPYSYNYYGVPFWFCRLVYGFKARGYKVALTCHEIFIDLELSRAKYWPVALSQRAIAFALARLADRVIVSIERTQRQLGAFGSKVTRIPIGSNILPVPVTDDQVQALRRELAPGGEFVFVSFGIRDQDAALRVLADLTRAGYPVRLVLLGKLRPEQRQHTEGLLRTLGLEGKVTMPGYLGNDALYQVLRCGDAFMLLEEKRGGLTTKSGSLAAAYAAGLPVLGTSGHMTDGFFRNGDNALFAREGDYEGTLANAKKIMDDAALRARLRQGAQDTQSAQLSWERIAGKYLAVLSEGEPARVSRETGDVRQET